MASKTKTISDLHSQLRGNYRQKWNEDTDAVCKKHLPEMYDQYGEARLIKGVERMIANQDFFEISTLHKFIPAADVARATVEPTCIDCSGTGWMPCAVVNPENRVKRCHCRRVIGA